MQTSANAAAGATPAAHHACIVASAWHTHARLGHTQAGHTRRAQAAQAWRSRRLHAGHSRTRGLHPRLHGHAGLLRVAGHAARLHHGRPWRPQAWCKHARPGHARRRCCLLLLRGLRHAGRAHGWTHAHARHAGLHARHLRLRWLRLLLLLLRREGTHGAGHPWRARGHASRRRRCARHARPCTRHARCSRHGAGRTGGSRRPRRKPGACRRRLHTARCWRARRPRHARLLWLRGTKPGLRRPRCRRARHRCRGSGRPHAWRRPTRLRGKTRRPRAGEACAGWSRRSEVVTGSTASAPSVAQQQRNVH